MRWRVIQPPLLFRWQSPILSTSAIVVVPERAPARLSHGPSGEKGKKSPPAKGGGGKGDWIQGGAPIPVFAIKN